MVRNDPDMNFDQNEIVIIQLRRLLENDYQFTNTDWEMVMDNFSYQSADRNTIVLNCGSIEKVCRVILKGFFKITFHGEEPYIFDFRKEGDYLTDVVSLTKKTKSSFIFETITQCEWIEVSYSDWMQLNDKISNAFSMIVVDYLQKGYQRAAFLRISNAKDRYEEFYKTQSEIVKYAKLEDIASYLDITPQSLSRIRKNYFR